MSEDEELARIRAQKQKRLEEQVKAQQQAQAQAAIIEQQKQRLLATFLTDEARTRLANIKLANPEFASALENQLISLYQSGQLRGNVITDDQLKAMLRQLQGRRKETKIHIQRK